MATLGDFTKNILWILVLLQVAPFFIRNIRQQYSDFFETKTKVGVINISGALYEAEPVINDLKSFFENDDIKAILLNIECPGGSAGACQTVFNELNYYKNRYPRKYIVAFVENIATSGGYYILSCANYSIAAPAALIGSIGSYVRHPNFKDFIESYKIKYEVIKTGDFKTQGNPLLDLTPEQRQELQGITNDIYRQFTRDVAHQRPQLSPNTKSWADGHLCTGEQALSLKLIDEVGSPSTILRVLKENAHIEGKIDWVKAPQKGFWSNFFGTTDGSPRFLSDGIQGFLKIIQNHSDTASACV